jgi:nicotinate-nucleotide adenylyltransferase
VRIGLLGGTCNPVHRGHLLMALAAQRHLGLHRVLFIPAHLPPHKRVEGNATAEDRAQMVKLALQGHPCFELSRVDLDRPPPSYTVDTVRLLRRQYPDRGNEWFFLVGSDTARELPSWREIAKLRKMVRFAAISRPGDPLVAYPAPGATRLPVTTAPVSSSLVRQRVRQGLEVRRMVPAAVACYIEQKGLYR